MKSGPTHAVCLLLGSNEGNRTQLLKRAVNFIKKEIGIIINKSSVYETSPWGFVADVDFLNQVLYVETSLSAKEILIRALKVEQKLGRIRAKEHFTSRTMDIDMLFYDSEVINRKELAVPHPKLHLRRFALEPMAEILPDLIHPVLGKPIKKLLQDCKDTGKVKVYSAHL